MSIEIEIKIVLLMAKPVVKRKLRSDFGENTSTEHGIRTILERFCEIGSVEDRLHSGRPTVIHQEEVDEVNDFLRTHPGSSVRSFAEALSISQTARYRIRTETFFTTAL